MMHHLIYNELILQTKHPLNDILLSPTNAFFISTLNSFHLFLSQSIQINTILKLGLKRDINNRYGSTVLVTGVALIETK